MGKGKLKKRLIAYGAVLATIVVVWQGSSLFFPSFLLPGIPPVLTRLARIIPSPEFLEALGISLSRLGLGFGLAVTGGTVLGLASGVLTGLRIYLRALVSVLQSVPPITWVPLLIITMGFGDGPIIVVVTLASFYPMVQSVMSAAEHVEKLHLQVAQVLGANPWQVVRTVYLPEVFPAIVTGAQISFGNAWRALVAAEMVAGVGVGLGWSITFAGEIADMSGVLAHIVVIGVFAAFMDQVVLELIKRRLLKWRYVNHE